MRLQGQTFGADIIARIRTTISEDLEATRSGLSRQVCEWLDWRSANGKLRELDARKALLELERSGLIQLPPARCQPQQLWEQGKTTLPPEIKVEGALYELGEVSLVAVSAKTPVLSRLWNSLMEAHHPLGSGPFCGAQQRYLIHCEQHGYVGGLAFSAAAWHLRDRWIGWSPKTRRDNLHKVVSNSRFLLQSGTAANNCGFGVALTPILPLMCWAWPRARLQMIGNIVTVILQYWIKQQLSGAVFL